MNSPLEQALKGAAPQIGIPEEKLRTMVRIQLQMEKLEGDVEGPREDVIETRLVKLFQGIQQAAFNQGQQLVQQRIRSALGLR